MRQTVGPVRDWPQYPNSSVGRPGTVLTVLKPDEVVVWLIGEIDVTVTLDLDEIARNAPKVADRLTIDGSRVTFCDSTLLRFVAIACEQMLVTVRRPSRILRDILDFSTLTDQVHIDGGVDEPL